MGDWDSSLQPEEVTNSKGRGGGVGRGSSKFATYPVDDVHQARITEGVEGLEIEWRENKKRDQ